MTSLVDFKSGLANLKVVFPDSIFHGVDGSPSSIRNSDGVFEDATSPSARLSASALQGKLLSAVTSGNHSATYTLARTRSIDINFRDAGDLTTPLHKAASFGNVQVIQALLFNGADTDALDMLNSAPLHYAAAKGHIGAIELLLSYDKGVCDLRDKYGYTPLHICVKNGHLEAARLLIDMGNARINFKRFDGSTAAHLACQYNHLDILQLLISKGAKLRMTDSHGDTPFLKAVSHSNMPIILYMLEQGLENVQVTNENGQNLVHLAAMHCNVELLEYLNKLYPSQTKSMIKDADTQLGFTALHHCCNSTQAIDTNKQVVIARMLIQSGVKLDVTDKVTGNTALNFAILRKQYVLASVLMNSGASTKKKNKKGFDAKMLMSGKPLK